MISISSAALLRAWPGIGWFGVALLLYLSLSPRPPEISLDHGDKVGHALAYAVLLYWWAQVFVLTRARVRLSAGLLALGIAIEYVQGWTGIRTFDYWDMLADAAGIGMGWLLAAVAPNIPAYLCRHTDELPRT